MTTEDTPTCMECFSATCRNNLLPGLTSTQQDSQLLTTGYFSTFPPKPQGMLSIYIYLKKKMHVLSIIKRLFFFFLGKCSHGGILDSSRHMGAKGGINKDSTSPLFSPHHYLHVEAAALATEATLTVLRDLRDTVGHETFLRSVSAIFTFDWTATIK